MQHLESHTLLLVSADAGRGDYLSDQFVADGFDVVRADDAAMAERALARVYPDVVVVDQQLPDAPGLSLVATVRQERGGANVDPGTPIVALCSHDDPNDRVRALERGADDVVGSPVHYPELLARVRGVLRRAQGRSRRSVLRVGPLQMDPVSRDVAVGEQPVDLSQKEYLLLQVLASDPTRVFSKEELLRSVWGFRSGSRTRTLDSHACRLRQKLQVDGARFVVNVWGVGYRLVDGPIEVLAGSPMVAAPVALAA